MKKNVTLTIRKAVDDMLVELIKLKQDAVPHRTFTKMDVIADLVFNELKREARK